MTGTGDAYVVPPPPPGPPRPLHALDRYPPPDPATAAHAAATGQPAAIRTNGLAITALILGGLWLWWIGSVLAVIFGHVAMSQIKRANGWQRGRGMAITGLVLGYLAIAVLVLAVVAVALGDGA